MFCRIHKFFDCSLRLPLLSAIKTISSAYANIPMLFSPSFTPSLSKAASQTTFSNTMLNKTGDMASPCLSPVVT